MVFKKYPSIDQFRSVVQTYRFRKEQDPLLSSEVVFTGTVKLHGTNAGIGYCPSTEEFWVQSRQQIITSRSDNVGFAMFVERHRESLKSVLQNLSQVNPEKFLVMYGEWCGGSIQANVGISGLTTMFVVFGVALYSGGSLLSSETDNSEDECQWLTVEQYCQLLQPLADKHIYSIHKFPHWTLSIDMDEPDMSRPQLVAITQEVERECPVAKYFGVSNGVGEGVVWTGVLTGSNGLITNIRFKVKGSKHSVTKVRTLASIVPEKIASIREFVEYAVTEQRLQQGFDELFLKQDKTPTSQDIGSFINWVKQDVFKEEIDTLVHSGLNGKDVVAPIAKKAGSWLKERL